jgi:hypothetical protein
MTGRARELREPAHERSADAENVYVQVAARQSKREIVMRRSIAHRYTVVLLEGLPMPDPQDTLRAELAAAAARLIADEGCDYAQAKRRAAAELAGGQRRVTLPDNHEVERELRRHLRLFDAETHPPLLAALRAVAARLMQWLAPFDPHLVGAVLNGTATEHSDVHLHLFVDSAKDVEVFLMDAGIDFDVDEGGSDERPAAFECLSFVTLSADPGLPARARQVGVRLHVYPRDAIRVAPRQRAEDPQLHPVEAAGRANLAALRRLIEDTAR